MSSFIYVSWNVFDNSLINQYYIFSVMKSVGKMRRISVWEREYWCSWYAINYEVIQVSYYFVDVVFLVVMPCRLVGSYQRFRGTYYLLLQGWRWRQHVSSKRWYLHASPYGVTGQKTNLDMFNLWCHKVIILSLCLSYLIAYDCTIWWAG
jgi:hypothetical protein